MDRIEFTRQIYPQRSPLRKRRKAEAPLMSIEDMNVAGNLARPLLDNSHLKLRSHLAHGAVAKRRPPSKVSSTVFKENDKNSNNIAQEVLPRLPKHLAADDRKNQENYRPVPAARGKLKKPSKGLKSDDSDASSSMFGGYRSEGNIAGEVNSNPHASAGVMLIASKPLQDSASNSVSASMGSQEDMLGSMSSLDDNLSSRVTLSLAFLASTSSFNGLWTS
ncbi:nab-1 [Bugula neritina]|uniref:Nab-1 n=1 Tax=Bugula neritina TaxID=10212 RepID=A0A7J7JA33_BUGNE|nr:nab-1 [Bugula neritina]